MMHQLKHWKEAMEHKKEQDLARLQREMLKRANDNFNARTRELWQLQRALYVLRDQGRLKITGNTEERVVVEKAIGECRKRVKEVR
jgi:hypothetical protein